MANKQRFTEKVGKRWYKLDGENGNSKNDKHPIKGFVRTRQDLPNGSTVEGELWFAAKEGTYYVYREHTWTAISLMDRLDL